MFDFFDDLEQNCVNAINSISVSHETLEQENIEKELEKELKQEKNELEETLKNEETLTNTQERKEES